MRVEKDGGSSSALCLLCSLNINVVETAATLLMSLLEIKFQIVSLINNSSFLSVSVFLNLLPMFVCMLLLQYYIAVKSTNRKVYNIISDAYSFHKIGKVHRNYERGWLFHIVLNKLPIDKCLSVNILWPFS